MEAILRSSEPEMEHEFLVMAVVFISCLPVLTLLLVLHGTPTVAAKLLA